MRVSDSFKLAKAKFKSRKMRSILSALAAGFMLVVLITASFFTSGVLNGVRDRSLSGDRYLASYQSFGPEEKLIDPPAGAINEFEIRRSSAGLDSIDGQNAQTIFAFDAEPRFFDTLEMTPDVLFDEYVHPEAVLSNEAGVVDIILSTNFVVEREDIRFSQDDSIEKRADTIIAAQEKYLNRDLEFNFTLFADYDEQVAFDEFGNVIGGSSSEPSQTSFIGNVIGFSPSSSTLFSSESPNIIRESDREVEVISELFSSDREEFAQSLQVFEFETSADREAFIDSCPKTNFAFVECLYYQDPAASIGQFVSDFKGFIRFVTIVLAVIVAGSMFVTVSKIIGDSERETGVFRAIGARRGHILQIYIFYSALIASAAFALAFVISVLVGLYLTSRYGLSFGFQIAEITGNYSGASRLFLIGVNAKELGQIFLIGLAAAIVGALIPMLRLISKDPIKAMRAD